MKWAFCHTSDATLRSKKSIRAIMLPIDLRRHGALMRLEILVA
jgi:hypothetical protein